MPQEQPLVKALMQEITWKDSLVQEGERVVEVQFNPQTLKLSFSNQNAGGDQRGGAAKQFIGNGVTKLSFDLWFDVTVGPPDESGSAIKDVRKLTRNIALFMAPEGGTNQDAPTGVRFLWGNFLFEGVMDSLSENLEFFSEDGFPLRASLSVGLTKQEIQFRFGEELSSNVLTAERRAPRQPLSRVRQGDTVQKIAAREGQAENWQQKAEANDIDNPRQPGQPGSLLRRATRRIP